MDLWGSPCCQQMGVFGQWSQRPRFEREALTHLGPRMEPNAEYNARNLPESLSLALKHERCSVGGSLNSVNIGSFYVGNCRWKSSEKVVPSSPTWRWGKTSSGSWDRLLKSHLDNPKLVKTLLSFMRCSSFIIGRVKFSGSSLVAFCCCFHPFYSRSPNTLFLKRLHNACCKP